MKPIIRYEKDLAWNVEGSLPAKILLSKQDTHTACVKVGTLEKGRKNESHTHTECDQLEYYLKGKALMFIEGLGEREIREGSFTYIPKGVRHGILSLSRL